MSYLSGILLLASVLALGHAAPVNMKAQRYRGIIYQQALNNLNALARQESVPTADLLRNFIDSINGLQAEEQWGGSVNFPLAEAEGSIDYGRVISDLLNTIGRQQEDMANQNSWDRGDYGRALTAIGGLFG